MDIQGNSMTNSFSEKLIEILKTDSRFVGDEDFAVSKEDRKSKQLFYGKSYNG
ncbi:hypothetical protein C5S31_02455 [ANME-1 cluster archaeon GoMg2]|nr:hypothetical protein [ANME-1 cluster archaeon GoMg2]